MLFIHYEVSNATMNKIVEKTPVVYTNKSIQWDSSNMSDSLDLDLYKRIMGELESNGNYLAVNRYGYLGKYQFHKRVLKAIGITNKKHEFLNDSITQEIAMDRLTFSNLKVIRNYRLDKYCGTYINGNEITLMGILAACHLVGTKQVRIYFVSDGREIAVDGNKTSMERYITRFSSARIGRDNLNNIVSWINTNHDNNFTNNFDNKLN